MKILQICTKVPYPPKDGGAAGIFVFSKAFADLGHHVTILAVNPPKHFTDTSGFNFQNISIIPVPADTAPKFLHALSNLIFTRQPYHVSRFSDKRMKDALITLLRSQPFDIIQLEGTYLGGLLPVIRKYSTAKVSLRAHNIEHQLWEDIAKSSKNIIKRCYLAIQSQRLKRFEIDLIKSTDCLISVSPTDLELLNAMVKSRSEVIPYGVNIQPEHSLRPYDGREDICFIGALDWLPNQEGIIWFAEKVCPLLLTELPTLKVHVAGRNAPILLKKQLKQVPNIVFHGEIEDASAFMQSYKAIVVPLFTGSGIRVKIIDALNYKLPVICTPKASEGTALNHGQHILYASDEFEFAHRIKELTSDNILANTLRENGYQYICNKYNSLALAHQMLHFIVSHE